MGIFSKWCRTWAACCVTVALGVASASASAQNPTRINFRLDWSIYGTHAPFYLALQKGMYAKAGLDVSISEGQGSATAAKFVAQGEDQLGFVDFTSMIRGVEQGMPLVAVMRVISNNMCVVSRADNPVAAPKDLPGKVIAFAPSESTAQMFPALLASQHIDPKTISVVSPAFGAKNALLLQKRADAITASINVQISQIEAEGVKTAYFPYSKFGIDMMNNGIVANRNFVAQHPDALRRFLKVTRDAFIESEKNPDEAVDALIAAVPQQARNRAVLRSQLLLSSQLYETATTHGKPFGYMDDEDWNVTQGLLLKYGGLHRAVPLKNLYTNAYLPE